MGKGSKKETTEETTQRQETSGQQMLDPASRRFVEGFMRPLAMGGAATALGAEDSFMAGPTAEQTQAMGGLSSLVEGGVDPVSARRISAGQLGFSPEQMDTGRISDFFNPFQSEVVDSMRPEFERQRDRALNRAADEAISSGAFGGSRSGFLQAQALNDVNRSEAQTVADLRRQGFEGARSAAMSEHGLLQQLGLRGAISEMDAQTKARIANQQAQLQAEQIENSRRGMHQQALGQLMSGGEQMRQIEQNQRREPLFRSQQALQFANMGMGPTGTVTESTQRSSGTRNTTTEESGDFFGDLLGAGMVAGGLLFPPAGAAGAAAGAAGGGKGGGGGGGKGGV